MPILDGSTYASFVIRLSQASAQPVSVDWSTASVTAVPGVDYQETSGTAEFLPGEVEKVVQVLVYGRAPGDDAPRSFRIDMQPSPNIILGQSATDCTIEVRDADDVVLSVVSVAQGRMGLTAYEIAVLQGFEGTATEWLESLKVTGDEGAPGPSAAQQLHELGVIDEPTIEAMNAYLAATGAQAGVDATTPLVAQAEAARDAAQLAEAGAIAASTIYATTGAGLAATTNGEYFLVAGASGSFADRYRNDSGVATFINSYPSKTALDAAIAQTRTSSRKGREASRRRRSATRNWHWTVKDIFDRVAAGLDLGLALNMVSLKFMQTARSMSKYPGAVLDAAGRVLSYYASPEGRLTATAGFQDDQSCRRRSARRYLWSVFGPNFRAALGLKPDGTTDLIPSTATAEAFWIDPADFSSDYQVANVRRMPGNALVATCQESDGMVSDIMRPATKDHAIAAGAANRPLRTVLVLGQSNATNTGSTNAIITQPLYPFHALAFEGLIDGHRNSLRSESAFVGFEGIYDPADEPAWPQTMMAFAREEKARRAGRPTDGILYYTSHYGGQPISTFQPGQIPYTNLMTGAKMARVIAANYSRSVDCKTIHFVQGESGPFDNYKGPLIDLAAAITTDVQAQMQLAAKPKLIVYQTNEYDNAATADQVFLWQMEAANESADIVGGGPMYFMPFETGDPIHLNVYGRMMQGELMDVVDDIVERTGTFLPLEPARSGDKIEVVSNMLWINLDDPGEGLAFETGWQPSVPSKGFVCRMNGTPFVPSAVDIVDNRIRITPGVTLSGLIEVDYAVLTDPATLNGWANGRGLLYSSSGVASTYHAMGHPIPEDVRFYCNRFMLSITV